MNPLAGPSLGFSSDDVVIVTGAGSGIGAATARAASGLGLKVVAWDVQPAGLASVIDDIVAAGGNATGRKVDVGDLAAVRRALAESTEQLGPIRYLVNNAGPASAGDFQFNEALQLAAGSVRDVTAAWLDQGLPQGAALVNVASVAGNVIGTAPDWYPAAKAAIMGYTRHLAAHRTGEVRANAVAPGMTDTPRLATFRDSEIGQRVVGRIPLRRMATPEEIAWPILFLLSPLASYINGALLIVDGGWTVTQ
jgi:NAD(P)-dependent dehydrogenase (short-subunit alcohol dehydrogenase family)